MWDFNNPIDYSCKQDGNMDPYSQTQNPGQIKQFENLTDSIPSFSFQGGAHHKFYAKQRAPTGCDARTTNTFKWLYEPRVEPTNPRPSYSMNSWGTQPFGYSMENDFDFRSYEELEESVSEAEDFLGQIVTEQLRNESPGVDMSQQIPSAYIELLPFDLQRLASTGHLFLAQTLAARTYHVYDKIRDIGHPEIMEQLVDLALLLESKFKEGNEFLLANTMNVALAFAESAIEREDKKSIEQVQKLLGEIIYLSNRTPEETGMNISPMNLAASESIIHKVFNGPNGPVLRIRQAVKTKKEAHKKSQIQDSSIARTVQLPVEIAKELVMDTGRINYGIIPILHEELLGEDNPIDLRGHKVNIFYGLKLMKNSPAVRTRFHAISRPSNPFAKEHLLIRGILGMAPGEPISDLDAKKAILATMMSHLRQGNAGTCFGTYLGIDLMISRLTQCMDDFSEIIQTGKLVRRVNGEIEEFPYLMKMAYENINKSVEIDAEGRMESGMLLAELPGIQSAFRQIGVSNEEMEILLRSILGELFKNQNPGEPHQKLTIKKLMRYIADALAQIYPALRGSEKEVINQLRFGFETETNPPLLRVWENILAGMAEGSNESNLKRETAVESGKLLVEHIKSKNLMTAEMEQQIISVYLDTLFEKIRFLYDPDYENNGLSADEHSSAGAFVLYEATSGQDPTDWNRLENPYQFQELLCEILDITFRKLVEQNQGQEVVNLEQMIRILKEHVVSNRFILDIVKVFNRITHDDDVNLMKLELIEKSPWVAKVGNDPRYVDQVYFNGRRIGETQTVLPYNAEHLLRQIIEKGREKRRELQEIFTNYPHKRVPIFTSTHAFSLLLGEPKLQEAWMMDAYIPELIESNLIIPGRKIAHDPINSLARKNAIKYCREQFIDETNRSKFDQKIGRLPKKMWMTHFRSELMQIVMDLEDMERGKHEKFTRRLDTLLFKELMKKTRAALISQMIPFADTNWNYGKHDGLFAFIYNPFADRLEIALLAEDQEVIMLDQNQWMTMTQWEFFTSVGESSSAESGGQTRKTALEEIFAA